MTATYLQRMRTIPRDVWLTNVGYVLMYMNLFGVGGVLLNLYLLRIGYDARYVGLVNAAMLAAIAAGAPLGGILGRRWGCRRLMIGGTIVATLGATLIALGDLLPPAVRSLWLPTHYALMGAGLAVFVTNSQVYVRAACGDEGCDHAYAMRSALGPVAGFLGALLGGLLPGLLAPALGVTLQDPAAYRWPLLGAGLLLGVGVVALLPTRDLIAPVARGAKAETRASPLPLIPIVVVMVFGLLRWIGNGPANTFMNVYLDAGLGASTATIGLVRALGQILAVPAALLMPLATARWGRVGVLMGGAVAMALALLGLALAPHMAVAAVCFVLTAVLFSLTGPVCPGYQLSLAPTEWGSVMVGMATLASGAASAGMALGGGHLIQSFGYEELFLISAGGAAASALVLWVYERVRTRAPARLAAPTLPGTSSQGES